MTKRERVIVDDERELLWMTKERVTRVQRERIIVDDKERESYCG